MLDAGAARCGLRRREPPAARACVRARRRARGARRRCRLLPLRREWISRFHALGQQRSRRCGATSASPMRAALRSELVAYRERARASRCAARSADGAALLQRCSRKPRDARNAWLASRDRGDRSLKRPRNAADGIPRPCRRWRASRAPCACPARRAFRIARCCSRRSRAGRTRHHAACSTPTTSTVMLEALRALGVHVDRSGDGSVVVHGAAARFRRSARRFSSATPARRFAR